MTLRSEVSLQRMEAVVEVQALALVQRLSAVLAAASARKAQMRPLQGLMAVVLEALALRLRASAP